MLAFFGLSMSSAPAQMNLFDKFANGEYTLGDGANTIVQDGDAWVITFSGRYDAVMLKFEAGEIKALGYNAVSIEFEATMDHVGFVCEDLDGGLAWSE